MGKFRIKYKNSWNEEKTIIVEGDYWTIFADAKIFFGKDNIISVEDLENTPVSETLSKEDDEYYIFDN